MSVMLMPGSLGDLDATGNGLGQAGAATSPAAAAAAAQQAAAAAAAAAAVQAAGQKDTTWTKLFVGGLPYHTTDKSLREHFSIFGDIEEAVVITDRQTGKSRGYGFVIMGDRPAADRACKDPNPIIDGRKANVNLAILGAKPRGTIHSLAAAFPGLRAAGYPTTAATVLQPQYGAVASPGYVYQSPYLTGAAGSLVSLGGAPSSQPLSHTAAAVAAATAASQFYEYQNAAAAAAAAAAASAYPGAGLADYPYTSAANAASYMPYTYALPQAALPTAAASALSGLGPYSAAAAQAASLQEARLQ